MADIQGNTTPLSPRKVIVEWADITEADDGLPVDISEFPDRTVQAVGTFGNATISIEGSNNGTDWVTLTDFSGSPVELDDETPMLIAQNPLLIRPSTANGSSSSVTVIIVGVR